MREQLRRMISRYMRRNTLSLLRGLRLTALGDITYLLQCNVFFFTFTGNN